MNILTLKNKKDLIKQYSGSNRYYHNLSHILSMFELASSLGIRLSDSQRLAIWYHDIVYDPTKRNNELSSADYFHLTNSDLPPHITNKVMDMIIDTIVHKSWDLESQIVIDLDLSILGSDYETYTDAKNEIRKEYSHLSESRWTTGRTYFLNSMLARPHIFNSDLFRNLYETQARSNIKMELNNDYEYAQTRYVEH